MVAEHVQQWHLADDGPVEIRPLRSDRAHEQAAVAASLSRNAGGVGVLLADEPLGAAVKVVEGVLLLVQHTAAVPALAVLVAAADTGLHHDHSAFQQRAVKSDVAGRDTVVESAVSVDQHRVIAVHFEPLLVVDEGGDLRAVL